VRRLTAAAARRPAGVLRSRLLHLRGPHGERGGIAVAVALLMPLVFGAAALAIDTVAVWSDRQQVENGADAAALAVAMDCANGNCGDIKATAEAAFWANDQAGKAADLGPGEGWVSVDGGARKVSITQKTPWIINHYFAAALGYGTGELSVQSYAAWAPTARATTAVPLAVSGCTYNARATTLPLATGSAGSCGDGTALTAVDSPTACATTSKWNTSVAIRPGSGVPAGCTSSYLGGLVGKNLVLPVYDSTAGSGGSTTYHVYGYAAFHVSSVSTSGTPALSGYFARVARQINVSTPPSSNAAPDLGAESVFLTPN
jgi:Putative Flp pilus-assembly TadE/G-like